MARRTREEIQKEVAEASAARKKAYFEAQAKAKTEAASTMEEVPAPDAYVYTNVWRQEVGGPGGQFNLVKTANPYYNAADNTIYDPATGTYKPAGISMTSSNIAFPSGLTSVSGKSVTSVTRNADGTYTIRYSDGTTSKSNAAPASEKTETGRKTNADGSITITYSDGTTSTIPAPSGKTEVSRKTNADGSVTITYSDGTTSTIPAPSGNTDAYKGSGSTSDPLTFNGIPFTGTRNGARYINGVLQVDSNNNQGGVTTGSGTASDPLLVNGKAFSGMLGGVNYVNGIAQQSGSNVLTATDIETKARRTAQQDFKAALGELGLADLAEEVDNMIKQDFTVAQIKMELPKTASYQLRFPGMKALRDAGSAINEATYISNEKGYLQTLRAYGLDTDVLGSRTALGTYIANMVAPREFEERVSMAVNRVNENPEVLETFKSFYPEVDKSGVAAYLLNPKAGMAIIKKQVRTSEIGAAAASAGFARDLMGISNIETLMPAVGETAYAGLRTEFLRARQLAQSQRRLAQIENQSYSDLEAIGAVVGDDAAKMLASERRAAREAARFSARGGVTGASLAGPTAI